MKDIMKHTLPFPCLHREVFCNSVGEFNIWFVVNDNGDLVPIDAIKYHIFYCIAKSKVAPY